MTADDAMIYFRCCETVAIDDLLHLEWRQQGVEHVPSDATTEITPTDPPR
jgi:hypothetical protein